MKINGQEVIGKSFAYEGCHKIYICENKEDEEYMKKLGYEIRPLDEIEEVYENSCSLRFVNNAQLDKTYVGQFEDAVFEH